jgi:hypothetical protein
MGSAWRYIYGIGQQTRFAIKNNAIALDTSLVLNGCATSMGIKRVCAETGS